MITLTNPRATVNITPWSKAGLYGYDVYKPNSEDVILFGLIYLEPQFKISMDTGFIHNMSDVLIVNNGIRLIMEHFKRDTNSNGKGHKLRAKRPLSLGAELKKRIVDNSIKNANRKQNK